MKRDISLDIVKGLACLLMILAHSKTMHLTVDDEVTTFFWYVGFFAPVVFFASVGVSLGYQLDKRTKTEIILSNALLMTFVYISQAFNFDSLFTGLTVSSVIAAYLLRWNSALLIIGIMLLEQLLIFYGISVRHLHGTLFSVIPWIMFIFIGDYLQQNKIVRLPVLILGSAAALYLKLNGAALNNQDPVLLFVVLGLALYSFFVLLSPHLGRVPYVGEFLAFLGKNTLLFLWVHFFLLKIVFTGMKLYAPLAWVMLLFTTAIIIAVLNKLNAWTLDAISDTLAFWLVCLAVFIFTTFIQGTAATYSGNLILFIFAMNYHNFLPALRGFGYVGRTATMQQENRSGRPL